MISRLIGVSRWWGLIDRILGNQSHRPIDSETRWLDEGRDRAAIRGESVDGAARDAGPSFPEFEAGGRVGLGLDVD